MIHKEYKNVFIKKLGIQSKDKKEEFDNILHDIRKIDEKSYQIVCELAWNVELDVKKKESTF